MLEKFNKGENNTNSNVNRADALANITLHLQRVQFNETDDGKPRWNTCEETSAWFTQWINNNNKITENGRNSFEMMFEHGKKLLAEKLFAKPTNDSDVHHEKEKYVGLYILQKTNDFHHENDTHVGETTLTSEFRQSLRVSDNRDAAKKEEDVINWLISNGGNLCCRSVKLEVGKDHQKTNRQISRCIEGCVFYIFKNDIEDVKITNAHSGKKIQKTYA